ncbi:hypothetical protein PLUA15_150025 [Pseudomonas lundensis]|uniref:Uncharacterized protein n=1 Tax=Pseudomonas lundensis TaxID=86185 RepID=A0AAX2H2L9_9PSED|nr:hypothetical protein PLUA15_150025 [Pseudomonas lundensis]
MAVSNSSDIVRRQFGPLKERALPEKKLDVRLEAEAASQGV